MPGIRRINLLAAIWIPIYFARRRLPAQRGAAEDGIRQRVETYPDLCLTDPRRSAVRYETTNWVRLSVRAHAYHVAGRPRVRATVFTPLDTFGQALLFIGGTAFLIFGALSGPSSNLVEVTTNDFIGFYAVLSILLACFGTGAVLFVRTLTRNVRQALGALTRPYGGVAKNALRATPRAAPQSRVRIFDDAGYTSVALPVAPLFRRANILLLFTLIWSGFASIPIFGIIQKGDEDLSLIYIGGPLASVFWGIAAVMWYHALRSAIQGARLRAGHDRVTLRWSSGLLLRTREVPRSEMGGVELVPSGQIALSEELMQLRVRLGGERHTILRSHPEPDLQAFADAWRAIRRGELQ